MALYIGLMSGTSMDSVDVALVEISPGHIDLIETLSHPIPAALRSHLEEALMPGAFARPAWRLHTELGELFAAAALAIMRATGKTSDDIHALGSHGQTVFHEPHGAHPCTVQLGDPNTIAYRTGITTVADFRGMDMAAGGQGAPLAPAFHQQVFGSTEAVRGVVNIGGIANLTIIPSDRTDAVRGFDTGPGNTLMDLWASQHIHTAWDQDGSWGAGGEPIDTLLVAALKDGYFSRAAPKSTGREYFNPDWLASRINQLSPDNSNFDPQDVQATLCELTARTIALACQTEAPGLTELFVCGGGAHNKALMQRLQNHLGGDCRLASTAELGLAPDWVEAAAFAWLAYRRLARESGNLPSVTGAQADLLLGGVYRHA